MGDIQARPAGNPASMGAVPGNELGRKDPLECSGKADDRQSTSFWNLQLDLGRDQHANAPRRPDHRPERNHPYPRKKDIYRDP